jgi:hypothetical protein
MMMKQYRLLIFFLATLYTPVLAFQKDSLLTGLLRTIDQREEYVSARNGRIATLREKAGDFRKGSQDELFNVYNALFKEYRKFIYDSAFSYATRLIALAHSQRDPGRIGYARAQLGYVLVSSGFFKEAFDTLKMVNAAVLPDSARAEYYALLARAYYDLGDFNNDRFYRDYYFQLGNQYTDSARLFCNPGEYYDLYLSRIKNVKTKNYDGALKDSEAILDLFKSSYEQQAVNYYDLSHSYLMIGNRRKAVEHLLRSALADLQSATKETAAMHALARLFYEDGDIALADTFIRQAHEDAVFYGARQRQMEIAAIQPLIAAAKLNTVDAQRKRFVRFSIALGVLVVVVIAFAFIIFKQLRKLKAAELAIKNVNSDLQQSNQELRDANRIKEEYIGFYFNINAEYLSKIESFKKAVDQKIMSRKFEELRYVVDNINLKREREELSYSFDRVFLNLFPDFVNRFNAMFRPEDQISLKEGHLLNTELRIFALIRMGIGDTEKIAKILGYSVNTIYAYKTRVKSRSLVPNDEFEQRIMEIRTA